MSPIRVAAQIAEFDSQTGTSNCIRWLVAAPSVTLFEPGREPSLAWQDWKSACSARGIRLLSWREYERMSDLRIAIENQKKELLTSRDYRKELYVHQRMELYPSPTPSQNADQLQPLKTVEDGFEELKRRIQREGPTFILVDGDFGTGKTFLLRRLALEFSEQGSHVIPLLIELRSLDKVLNADDMLVTRLSRLGEPKIEPAQLAYMAESGHLLILFDGYDELALRVNFDRAADYLSIITSAARGKAIVVLTCRTQHFASDHQMLLTLMKQDGLFRAKLLPFTEQQIRDFLMHKLGNKEAAEKRFGLIQEIKDLLGLSQNPRMLSFIADLPDKDLADAQTAAPDGKITAAGLYETILDRWLRNEVERHSHLQRKEAHLGQSAAPTSISDKQYLDELWEAVTRLAFLAWGRMERPFEIHEIQQILGEIPRNLMDVTLSPEERTQGIASGSLLSREAPGQFAFAHYSIPEFLITREIARQLKNESTARPLLKVQQPMESFSREPITDLMAEFLIDQLTWGMAAHWADLIGGQLPEERLSKHSRKNAIRLLDACGSRITNAPLEVQERMTSIWQSLEKSCYVDNFDDEDLRGRTFSGELTDASFVSADLTQASLRECDLAGATFENATVVEADLTHCILTDSVFCKANLSEANLSYADLRYADLTGANLTRATLIGADLRGAVLTGSQWNLARLAGATLDDPQLVGLAAFGAGLPVVIPTPEMRSGASPVYSVAWAPQHDLIATGHDNGTIVLWDASSGKEIRALSGHTDWVRSVAFSPDGSRLASGSDDKTLRLWDASSGKEIRALSGHEGSIWSVAFSPDGSRLASGSSDKTLRLWDASSGKEIRALSGHKGSVMSVAFWQGPSGPLLLLSSGTDGTIRIWNADNGNCLGILMANGDAWAGLRPDGRYRVVGDMKQYLWHVSGLARYELGELDTVYPELKLADAEPLIPPMYFR